MSETSRIEELRRRVQSDPASIAFAALAEEYRRAGRFEESIATCTAGLVRHPSYLSAHVTLGRALMEVGRFEDAREELEHVLRLAPENLAAIRGLADINHLAGHDVSDQYAAADRASEEADARDAAAAGAIFVERRAAPAARRETVPPPGESALAAKDSPAPEALAGLEEFLLAIQRARSERATSR